MIKALGIRPRDNTTTADYLVDLFILSVIINASFHN